MMYFKKGSFNVIIDGQFGSTGKGLYAGYLAEQTQGQVDLATTNAAPNAGHTYICPDGLKVVAKHLPIVGIVTGCDMYLNAGAVIDPDVLREEIEKYRVDVSKLFIHPHAAVIRDTDKMYEKQRHSGATRIGSTQSGVGEAIVKRVRREPSAVACNHPYLKQFCRTIDINNLCDNGKTVVCEVPQGLYLGLTNSGFYPHVTSRNVSIAQAMSDADVHPRFLGFTHMAIRTFPIRVGHIFDADSHRIGNSGPFFRGSVETSWEDMEVEPERTTVTNRIRRVATFSEAQFLDSITRISPDFIFLNFINYFPTALRAWSFWMTLYNSTPSVSWRLGYGPRSEDIVRPMQLSDPISWLGNETYNRLYDEKGNLRHAS